MNILKSEKRKKPSEISSKTFCIQAPQKSKEVCGIAYFTLTIRNDRNTNKYFFE